MPISIEKSEVLMNPDSILAMTFGGDIKEFESKAKQIEKSKTLTKVQLQCLKDYTELPRGQQEKIRHQSGTSVEDPSHLRPCSKREERKKKKN